MKNIYQFSRNTAFIAFFLIIASVAPTFAQAKPREERLLNGLKLLVWRDNTAQDVTVRVRIHGGSAFDPQGKEGVMRLLADNIFPNDAAREFFTEELGGSLTVTTNYDYIEISASGRSDSLLTLIETLAPAVANMTIDKPTTARLKDSLTAQVKALETDPAYLADAAATKRLFGTFPYGRPKFGTPESIAKIDFADLIDAKQRFLTADNATVAIKGNFDQAFAFKAARRLFGAWLKSDRRIPSAFRQPDAPANGMLTIPSPKPEQAEIRYAVRGLARNDKDLAAAKIYASILETKFKARVPSVFAEKAFAKMVEHTLPGFYLIGFSAGKNDVGSGNGKIEANDLIAKSLADPVTEAEFNTARSAFAAEWAKIDTVTFWLDADTFKIADPHAEPKRADTVALVDVRRIAENVAKQPIVTVLVNTPN